MDHGRELERLLVEVRQRSSQSDPTSQLLFKRCQSVSVSIRITIYFKSHTVYDIQLNFYKFFLKISSMMSHFRTQHSIGIIRVCKVNLLLYFTDPGHNSDSLVLSIPCQIITWQKGFLCHRSTTLEFTTSRYPKFEFFTNFPFQTQNSPLQNCIPSLGSFPSPWTVYPDFDSCYSHFMPYRMTPSVRHRAIEVHYYYYYYY